jgi:hypothetical protein
MLAPMSFIDLPAAVAWQHQGARTGFEVAFFETGTNDLAVQISGCTTAIEADQTWTVDYAVLLDATWATRRARVNARSESGSRSTLLSADGLGHWTIDGDTAPQLDGCLDVDLESSALTNAFPIHRLGLAVGMGASALAAYVRLDLSIEKLAQHYVRTSDEGPGQRYEYSAPTFGFTSSLVYDAAGLVLEYPGIAKRAR